MEVIREAYSDPTSTEPYWLTCEFQPIQTLSRPIPLVDIKASPALSKLPLIQQPRLSVMQVMLEEYREIVLLSSKSAVLE
jgi:predicted RNA-binding protein with PUA-like domain